LLEGGITLTYDDILNKVTITNTVAPFTLNFTGNNTVAAVLGFEKKIYSSANTQVSTFGPKIYNLMLYFTIEDIPTTYLTTIGNYSFAVPCNVNKLELLQYYAKSQTSVILNLKDNNLKTLNIRVYTEDGFIAQGLSEWCFAIKLL
jgi:hypothetical protein